jgi:hypothetical protein
VAYSNWHFLYRRGDQLIRFSESIRWPKESNTLFPNPGDYQKSKNSYFNWLEAPSTSPASTAPASQHQNLKTSSRNPLYKTSLRNPLYDTSTLIDWHPLPCFNRLAIPSQTNFLTHIGTGPALALKIPGKRKSLGNN